MLITDTSIDEHEKGNEEAYNRLWKVSIPFRVKAFGWMGFINRLSAKDQLKTIGVLSYPHNLCYVLCFSKEKNLEHLFFNCSIAKKIWQEVISR